jgi:alpha-beta hydrolase superfamily lysophospholipase
MQGVIPSNSPSRNRAASWALALGAAILLCQCGSPPGAGPTEAQVAERLKGRETGTFETHDGKELGYVAFRSDRSNNRRAAFLYLHGIESHSGWFDEAARQLATRGYPVFSLDRRGSGINRENRGYVSGHVERGTNLVEDIHRAVRIARDSGKVDEIYLIGLSWGGKYVMAYDATYPGAVDGMVLVTPGMKPKVDLGIREKLAVLTDSIFAPKRQHRIPIEPTMFTTTPKYLSYIENDPLKLKTVSASFLMQSLKMDRVVKKLDDGDHPPMLVFLAGKDRIIDNEATRELVTRDPRRSVEIIEYEDQTHSIQLDAPERMTRDIVEWLEDLPRG